MRGPDRAGEHLEQTAVNVVPGGLGQGVERFGIDQVAARILEQPTLQIEIAERSSPGIARSTRCEFLGESGCSGDRVVERGLGGEKQVTHQLLGGALDLPPGRLRERTG